MLSEFLFHLSFWPSLESPSSGILFPLGTGTKRGIPPFLYLYRNIAESVMGFAECLQWCIHLKLSVDEITFKNALYSMKR